MAKLKMKRTILTVLNIHENISVPDGELWVVNIFPSAGGYKLRNVSGDSGSLMQAGYGRHNKIFGSKTKIYVEGHKVIFSGMIFEVIS